MKRQEFREKLQQCIAEDLQATLAQYIEVRFNAYQQLLRYFSAIERKYETENIIKRGFPGVLKNIEDTLSNEERDSILDRYLSSAERVAEVFPEVDVWKQKEERFLVQQDDSAWVAVLKRGKRAYRGVAGFGFRAAQFIKGVFGGKKKTYPKWKQEIPVGRTVSFELLEAKYVLEWGHTLERVQLDIIREIEELLVGEGDQQKELDLGAFVSDQKDKLETRKNELLQNIEQKLSAKQSQIVDEIETVGTLERRALLFETENIVQKKEKLQLQFQKHQEQWEQVQSLFFERTKDVVQFLNLRTEINEQVLKFKDTFDDIFRESLRNPLKELSEDLQTSIDEISKEDSIKDLKSLNKTLTTFVEDQLIEPIQKLLDKNILSEKTEHLFEDLLLSVGQFPEDAQLVFDADLDKNPPKVNQEEVEWRQLVMRALRELFMNPLLPDNQQYGEFLSQNLEEIIEIKKIISVNIDSALEAPEEDIEEEAKDDPQKVVREALQRILAKVHELNKQADEKWKQLSDVIEDGKDTFFSSLLMLLHEGDSKQLQRVNAKYAVKEKTQDWHTVLDSRWARVQDRLMLWSRFILKKGNKYITDLKSFLGFKEEKMQEGKRADIATYLSETDSKMKELPYIYRRLFDFQSLADKQFFEPVQESTLVFKKAYEQWQNKFPTNFAIVGEKGSGKSSFINLIVNSELEEEQVISIDFAKTIWQEDQLVNMVGPVLGFESPKTIEELVTAIKESDKRQVVALESIQNCFVRQINGFKAIEKLSYLISETREHIFWIVSCSRYAWAFLDKVVQISEYLSHITQSDSLNGEQITRVILSRHQASGYSLYFEPDDQIVQSRTYRKLKDQEQEAQEHLKEEYFEKLMKLAEGNPSIAMIFWIRSIRDFDETYFYIQPLEVTSVEMIEDLNPEVLFALAAFVLHDTLLDEELAMVLNIKLEESRLILNRLLSRGMLVEKNDSYTINHLMYRQIVRVLKERNIIHLG